LNPCPVKRLVFVGRAAVLIEKIDSIVMRTGTATPSFSPGSNVHSFSARTASSSSP